MSHLKPSKYTFYISINVYLTNDLSLFLISLYFISVHFSCSIMANSLGHHGLQHIRLPTPTPGVAQTHVHSVCDATQLSHALLSPSPPASNLSQHQGLFQWVSSSSRMAKVLEFHLPYQSFNKYSVRMSFRIDWFDVLSVQRTLKSILQHQVQKHQFFSAQFSL